MRVDAPLRSPIRRVATRLGGCLLAAAGCLLLVGCNQGKQLHSDLIQRELRLQEDEIYRLEDYLEEYQRKVCRLRAENQQLRTQAGGGSGTKGSPTTDGDQDDEQSLLDLPEDDTPAPELPEIDFGDPVDELPAGDLPANEPPVEQLPTGQPSTDAPPFDTTAPPATSDEAPPFRPGDDGSATPAETLPIEIDVDVQDLIPAEVQTTEPPIKRSSFTGKRGQLTPLGDGVPLEATPRVFGVEVASRPGPAEPDGQPTLLVLATPRTQDGQPVVFAGEASVLLRDPYADEGQRNLARWDFNRREVADSAGAGGRSADIEFLVALPAAVPVDRPVELWVRLIDDNGAKTLGMSQAGAPNEFETAAEAPSVTTAPTVVEPSRFEEPRAAALLDPPPEPPELVPPEALPLDELLAEPLVKPTSPESTQPSPAPAPQRQRPTARIPGWHNPKAPRAISLPPGFSQSRPVPAATSSTIRLVTHEESPTR